MFYTLWEANTKRQYLFWYSDRFDLGWCKFYFCNSKLQPTRCNVSWFIYFYRCSTCFRRFLRPSSGAHNCTYSFRYCQLILLLAATVEELELSSSSSTAEASSNIIQGINFSQTQQFITHNILMATCFDSVESSSGLPKNRSNVSKFYSAFWDPKRLQ